MSPSDPLHSQPSPGPRRVLFVCTANICRSPTAEAIARHRFSEERAVFRSAGFLDDGRACPPMLLESLADLGVDASHHRSYQLDESSLDVADIVLTMEGEHVQKATLLHPSAFDKILPLREAADQLSLLPAGPTPVEDLLASVAANRDPASYLSTTWDVADPYGRKLKDYRRAVAEISELVDRVVGRLV